MTVKDTLTMRYFPVVTKTNCPTINRIHPLKQNVVSQLYLLGSRYKELKRICIFGSSTTGLCHVDSDIDICLILSENDDFDFYELTKEIGEVCDWNCDILNYSNLGQRLRTIIEREGVIIYEQITS